MIKLVFILVFLLLTSTQKKVPQEPIIGIYTQTYQKQVSSYIASSYVKFIQMSGAQVVPIYAFSPKSQILDLMTKINGVLFPGGNMRIDISNVWTKNADVIFKYAMRENDNGNVFPIFATCLGHELVAYLTAGYKKNILSKVGNKHFVQPITITKTGYIFKPLTQNHIQKLTTGDGLLYFNHNWAITQKTFNQNSMLNRFWNSLALGKSAKGISFIAVMQSKKYPFYTVQFHPQKNLFEWKVDADRSYQSIQIPQIFSNRFMEQARKNKNKFSSRDEFDERSIYNFQTERNKKGFTQVYIFDQASVDDISEEDENDQQVTQYSLKDEDEEFNEYQGNDDEDSEDLEDSEEDQNQDQPEFDQDDEQQKEYQPEDEED